MMSNGAVLVIAGLSLLLGEVLGISCALVVVRLFALPTGTGTGMRRADERALRPPRAMVDRVDEDEDEPICDGCGRPSVLTRSAVGGGGVLVELALCDRCSRSGAATSAAADAVAARLALEEVPS